MKPEPTVDLGFTAEPFPAGTHMCLIYRDEQERRDVISRYLEAGVAGGEMVGYFADAEVLVDDYLEEMGVSVPESARERRVLLRRSRETYCPDGRFDIERMLDKLRTFHQAGVEQGLSGTRVSGEMGWALEPVKGCEGLIEYEARVNLVLREHPVTAICQYDANRFDGATLFEVISVHPVMVVRGQVVNNPYYVQPETFLARLGEGGR